MIQICERQLDQAKQQSMTQQKPANCVGLNEDQNIDTGHVLMYSETAAARCGSAPFGWCWPQTVSTPKKITCAVFLSFFFCLPLIAFIFTALVEA